MATYYALVSHQPSGEVYAVRHDAFGQVSGVCGPLAQDERDAPGDEYHYDDQPEDTEWFMEIGSDLRPNESLGHIRDL